MSSIDPAALAELKARHVAFLEARLVSAKAEAEWRVNLEAGYHDLLKMRVREVARASALADAANALLTSEAVERAARPVARRALGVLLEELAVEKGKVGDRVSLGARRHLDALMERPGLLPDKLLREIAKEDAVDEVMQDVLYDALKEFMEKVNPFFADWGLPALVKKISPFGFGKGLQSLQGEFNKRLEPEIRKFIQGFSRKSLKRMVEFVITHGDEPKFVAVKKHLLGWVLAQEIGDLARSADQEALALGVEAGLQIVGAELDRSEHRARRRALLEEVIAARQDRTVGDVLAELGVTLKVDFDALAAASWPAVRAVLGSGAVKAWLAALIEEFYDAEGARGG